MLLRPPPMSFRQLPTTIRQLPTTSEVAPTLSDHLPTISEVAPILSDHPPIISDDIPNDFRRLADVSRHHPATCRPMFNRLRCLPTSSDALQTSYAQSWPTITLVPDTQDTPCLITPSQDIRVDPTPAASQETTPDNDVISSPDTPTVFRALDENEVDPIETFIEALDSQLLTNPDEIILSPTVTPNLCALDPNEVDPMETFLNARNSQPSTKRKATDSIEALEASLRNAASAYLPPSPPTQDSTSSPTPTPLQLTADHDDPLPDNTIAGHPCRPNARRKPLHHPPGAPPSSRRKRPVASDFFNLSPPHSTHRCNPPQPDPPTTEQVQVNSMDTAETDDPAQPEIDRNAPAAGIRKQALLEEFGRFNADLSWDQFSEMCAEFADRGQELGQIVSRNNPHRPQPRRPD